jgi:colicin import membrane protein
MTTAVLLTTPNEKALSGALALVMHLLFVALLIFGVSWQKHQPEAMIVDLWNNLPPVPAPKAEPPPEVKPEPEPPKPEPPKAEVKPVPKPVPKVETKPDMKADIALREKKEKERKAQEQALAEKKKREQEVADKKRREQEQSAALQKLAQEAADKQRVAREQEEALRKLAQQQASAQTKLMDEYVGKIRVAVHRRINKDAGCASLGDPEVHVKVTVLPDGNVLGNPTVVRSSGASPCDNAIARAVLLAQPLPVPTDPALFSKFRELNLVLYPNR